MSDEGILDSIGELARELADHRQLLRQIRRDIDRMDAVVTAVAIDWQTKPVEEIGFVVDEIAFVDGVPAPLEARVQRLEALAMLDHGITS